MTMRGADWLRVPRSLLAVVAVATTLAVPAAAQEREPITIGTITDGPYGRGLPEAVVVRDQMLELLGIDYDYLARDVEGARTFYGDVGALGADQQQRPDLLMHYVLTRPGPRPVAGVVPLNESPINPNWLPYVRVDDAVALAARVESLGGQVLLAPRDDVRNSSVAIVTDPGGAAVALQEWPF